MLSLVAEPLFIFLALVLLNFPIWVVTRRDEKRRGSQGSALQAQIQSLKKEVEKLNTPATYALCAKRQREIIAKEKELAAINERETYTLARKVQMILGTTKVLVLSCFCLCWWGQPLLHLPPEASWPFTRLLAFPHLFQSVPPGAVFILPWTWVCDVASRQLSRVVYP